MPVVGVGLGERPGDSFDRQAPGDLGVLEDILAVIKIYELVAKRLAEDQPGDRSEENTDAEDHPAIVQMSRRCFYRRGRFFRSSAHSVPCR